MDCTTFQESEIDALYGELDAAASAAMAEHAATCPACAARFERLKGTRGLVLSVAVEPVPTDFESRIMAAVDAGMAKRAAPPAPMLAAVPMIGGAPHGMPPGRVPHAKPEAGGAKIFGFMSRPVFAAAATFVLILGGAALLMTMTQRAKQSPMAASAADNAPIASAMTPVPMGEPAQGAVAAADPAVAATATAAASMAFAENSKLAPAAAPPPMAPGAPPVVVAAKAVSARPASGAGGGAAGGDDRALAAAKALYAQGRYADALPKFEALRANNPEADLYAARCIAKTRGCAAAAPRFDQVAQNNAGTDSGNRATLEGARCYQANGELAEARKRYSVAKDEDGVSTEAQQALDQLDRKAGSPGAGVHASPKAMPAPAPAPAAAPVTTSIK